jgi:hypothetical protein
LTSHGITHKYVDKKGNKRVAGGPRLKATQTYTKEFGKVVADLKRKYVMQLHLLPKARRTVAHASGAVMQS